MISLRLKESLLVVSGNSLVLLLYTDLYVC